MAGIKDIAARFKLRLMLKNHRSKPVSFPLDIMKTECLMVCLPPGQRELTMIKQFLPDLSRIFSGAEIYLLASPGSQVYGIFPRKGYRIMTPSGDQLTWSGLARKNYINILKQNHFDLILDLNLAPNYFVKSILLSFPNSIRIGSGSNLGAPYYNLEIKSKYLRDEKNIYRSIIEIIGKFRENRPSIND